MSGKYELQLSRSQQMALIDLIAHMLRCRCEQRTEEFIDCSEHRPIRTTPGELLRVVSDAKFISDADLESRNF